MDNEAQVTCERCEQQAVVYRGSLRTKAALENALPVGWVVRRESKGSSGRMILTVYCPTHANDATGMGRGGTLR